MGAYFHADNGDFDDYLDICGHHCPFGIFRMIPQHFLRMQKASRGGKPRLFVVGGDASLASSGVLTTQDSGVE